MNAVQAKGTVVPVTATRAREVNGFPTELADKRSFIYNVLLQ
jgi:hypothetical protein